MVTHTALILLIIDLLTILYARRRVRSGRLDSAPTSAVALAQRERGFLILALAACGAYSLTVVFLSIFWNGLIRLMLAAPVVYLVAWLLPRPFIRRS